MWRLVLLVGLVGLVGACRKSHPSQDKQAVVDHCTTAKLEGPLRWIADDYATALACARQKKVPLVLDLWAPWCHTCLSMQSTVFMDKSFAADRDKFVFASLDTDRELNAAALVKLSISAWPTFYVVGNDEVVLARFVGAASVDQFHNFLDAGARAKIGGVAAAEAHLTSADRALAVKDLATAELELVATIKAAPEAWLHRPEVLGSLILTKQKRGDPAGCLDVADTYMPVIGNAPVASDFLATAMACAKSRAKDDPPRVQALRERAVARWRELLADPKAPLSVDDRADAMAGLRETLDELDNKPEAKAIAEQELALVDDAAAKAPTPIAAMTYIWPRAEVYAYLGRPLELVPAFEKLAADLPNEYEPRARLGWIYLKAGNLADAVKWTDAALALVYGPRKGRLLIQRADIAAAAGDKTAERSFRQAAVKQYETLPASQQVPEALAKARDALAALDAGSAAH